MKQGTRPYWRHSVRLGLPHATRRLLGDRGPSAIRWLGQPVSGATALHLADLPGPAGQLSLLRSGLVDRDDVLVSLRPLHRRPLRRIALRLRGATDGVEGVTDVAA